MLIAGTPRARTDRGGNKVSYRIIRRWLLSGSLVLTVALTMATSATALTGTPLKIAEPVEFGEQSIAVDESGTAYLAWSDEGQPGGAHLQYCVLPAGASRCTHGGTLPVTGNGSFVVKTQVLVDADTVVVLAYLYGPEDEDVPVQEWQSTNGGESFAHILNGSSVADAHAPDGTPAEMIGAVVLPGPGWLGEAGVISAGYPVFAPFHLSSPPLCSREYCPAHLYEEETATLQPTSPTPLSNVHGVLASQLTGNPGVLAIYPTNGPPGCTSGFGTALAYGEGIESYSNQYDLSPGSPKSAWHDLTAADCDVEYPAVAGGPSGFGVVEENETSDSTVYHSFDEANQTFDTPYITIATEPERQPSISQDGSGGIYVTYSEVDGGPIRLAYSSDRGASWTGPATLAEPLGASYLSSAVGSDGQGWVTWSVGDSIYAQQFVASDATPAPIPASPTTPSPTPNPSPAPLSPPVLLPASITIPGQTDSVAAKGSLSVVLDCAGSRCSGGLALLVKVRKTSGKGKKKTTRTVEEKIGAVSFSSLSLGTDKVAVKLNGEGLRLLQHDRDKLICAARVTYPSGPVSKTITGVVTLEAHASKPKQSKAKKS
jgi:hypothetical protein